MEETKQQGFARRLSELIDRSELGKLPLTDQAKALKLSKALLHQWKNGRTARPDYQKVKAICERLGANVDWLLRGRGNPQQTTSAADPTRDLPRVGVQEMTLEQHKAFIGQLFESIPATARTKVIQETLKAALERKWIDHIPDEALAGLSAHDKIKELQRNSRDKTES